MIEPGTYNFTIYAGATWDRTFTVSDSGGALNWTGYSARMQIKQYENSTAQVTLTSATGGGITLGGSAGTIALVLTAAQTNTMPAGKYYYDLELTIGTTVTRILQGKVTVSGQITV